MEPRSGAERQWWHPRPCSRGRPGGRPSLERLLPQMPIHSVGPKGDLSVARIGDCAEGPCCAVGPVTPLPLARESLRTRGRACTLPGVDSCGQGHSLIQ